MPHAHLITITFHIIWILIHTDPQPTEFIWGQIKRVGFNTPHLQHAER